MLRPRTARLTHDTFDILLHSVPRLAGRALLLEHTSEHSIATSASPSAPLDKFTAAQVVMSGDTDAFVVIPKEIVQVLPTDWRDKFAAMRIPVMKATRGMHGIGRVGRDFIETFAGWLAVDRLINNPDSPATWADWEVSEDDSMIMERATNKKQSLKGRRCLSNPWQNQTHSDVSWFDKILDQSRSVALQQRNSVCCSAHT